MRECDGYLFGAVLDDISEHSAEHPDAALLVDGMIAQWRLPSGELMPVPDLLGRVANA
jgi:hypothetical protein